MFPFRAARNFLDSDRGNPKSLAKGDRTTGVGFRRALDVKPSDLPNIVLSKPGIPVGPTPVLPRTLDLVLHVLGLRSKPDMAKVNAKSVIAGMEHGEPSSASPYEVPRAPGVGVYPAVLGIDALVSRVGVNFDQPRIEFSVAELLPFSRWFRPMRIAVSRWADKGYALFAPVYRAIDGVSSHKLTLPYPTGRQEKGCG